MFVKEEELKQDYKHGGQYLKYYVLGKRQKIIKKVIDYVPTWTLQCQKEVRNE